MVTHKNLVCSVVFVFSLGLLFGWGIILADSAQISGIYTLIEIDGKKLPATPLASPVGDEECERVIVQGALLLDSEGRSAAFVTERITCPSVSGSTAAVKEHSVIFGGTYSASDNRITIIDDFGTDYAVLEGNVLVYETGGEGRPVSRFVLERN